MLERASILLILAWTLWLWVEPATAQTVQNQPGQRDPSLAHSAKHSAAQPSVDAVLTKIILEHMPLQYADDKKWGKQEKRWDGVDLRYEGIKLKTKRRWKMVNHGTWKKYDAQLVNPEHEFAVELTNLRNTPDGKTAFDLNIGANLNLQARQSKWVKGVQLYSISAEGNCRIRIKLSCQTQILLDLDHLPPDVIFKPRITNAQLFVDEFRLDRISKVGGEVAQQITKWVRSAIDGKVEEQQEKLVAKLNAKLDKNQENLRLSLSDAMRSKWVRQTSGYLPKPVQSALNQK